MILIDNKGQKQSILNEISLKKNENAISQLIPTYKFNLKINTIILNSNDISSSYIADYIIYEVIGNNGFYTRIINSNIETSSQSISTSNTLTNVTLYSISSPDISARVKFLGIGVKIKNSTSSPTVINFYENTDIYIDDVTSSSSTITIDSITLNDYSKTFTDDFHPQAIMCDAYYAGDDVNNVFNSISFTTNLGIGNRKDTDYYFKFIENSITSEIPSLPSVFAVKFNLYDCYNDYLLGSSSITFPGGFDKTIKKIELINPLSKVDYQYGDEIDIAGTEIKIIYEDDSYKEIDSASNLINYTTEYSYLYGSKSHNIVDIDTNQYLYLWIDGCGDILRVELNVEKFNPTSLDDLSWETIKILSKKNTLSNYFNVGAEKSITLNGNISSLNFSSYETKAILADISYDGAIFMLGDGAFTEYDITTMEEEPSYSSIYTFAVNQTNVNNGGWKTSNIRSEIQKFKDIVPSELSNVLDQTKIYSDNIGSQNVEKDAYSLTEDYFYLPSEVEICGDNSYGNTFDSFYNHQLEIYKDKEASAKIRNQISPNSTLPVAPINYWTRCANIQNKTSWVCINEFGTSEPKESNKVCGINVLFKL